MKIKNVSVVFGNELGGKIIIEVLAIRPKRYAYLTDDGCKHKKAKGTSEGSIQFVF